MVCRLNYNRLRCAMNEDLTHVRFHGTTTAQLRAAHHRVPARAANDERHQRNITSTPPSAVGLLATSVLRRGGVNPAHYRNGPLARRVPACLRALKVECEAMALARVSEQPSANGAALEAFLIGVSAFFRDPAVFDKLRTELTTLAAGTGTRRILSVGCSSGAELYSVAILLAEAGLLD